MPATARIAFVLLFLAATTAHGKPTEVALAPKWKADERVSVKMRTVTTSKMGGRMAVLATRTVEYVQETTAVTKGIPQRATRKFSVHQFAGPMDDEPQKHPLTGKTLKFNLVDGVLKPEEEIADLILDPMPAGGEWTWVLPGKKVVVGQSWTARSGMHMLYVHVGLLKGKVTCTLASVEGDTALIRISKTDKGDLLDGEAEFSLKSGRVVKATLAHKTGDPEEGATTVRFALKALPKKGS